MSRPGMRAPGVHLADLPHSTRPPRASCRRPSTAFIVTLAPPFDRCPTGPPARGGYRAMTTLLIVTEVRFYREGLAEVLSRRPELSVAGTAAERDEARRLTATLRPDVVLLDGALPGARELVAGSTRTVVMAMED